MVKLDIESNLLKSFPLKKLNLPHRRLEQQTKSVQPLKIARHFQPNYNYKNIIEHYLKDFHKSLHILFSAISGQCIEFNQGLLALLMAQDHRTAFLQVTNEIIILPDFLFSQSILRLNAGHPPLGAQTEHYDIPLASLLATAPRRPGNKRTERFHDVNYQ